MESTKAQKHKEINIESKNCVFSQWQDSGDDYVHLALFEDGYAIMSLELKQPWTKKEMKDYLKQYLRTGHL